MAVIAAAKKMTADERRAQILSSAAEEFAAGGWTAREHALPSPLVDLRLLRHPAVAGANAAMLVAGAGMYLLLTCIVRSTGFSRLACSSSRVPPASSRGAAPFASGDMVARLLSLPKAPEIRVRSPRQFPR